MTTSDKLREIAEKHKFGYQEYVDHVVSEYTALISENYVEKAKYDEAVRHRDELREALQQIIFSSGTLKTVQDIAEAAIKNTDG